MEEALERLEIQLEEVKQMNEKGKTESLELNHINDMAKEDFNITPSLERVGVSIPSFMMPNMEMLSPSNVSRRFNEYAHAVNMEHSSSSHIAEMLGDLINRRTSELKNLYSDVSESLADVLNTNIDHPIDEYISEIQSDENSPATRDNETVKKNDKKQEEEIYQSLEKYKHLTFLTFEQFQDQKFLRNRIKKILTLQISPVLQRLLIQKLMSCSYIEKQNHIKAQLEKQHHHLLKGENGGREEDVEVEEDDIEDDEVFLTKKDKTATYFSIEDGILGCPHYRRNCKIECHQCHRWYPCHLCHDEEITSHRLERKMVKFVLCMYCFTPQHPEQFCVECDRELGKYFCFQCTLYDNDPLKNIYHCDKCGICRLGLGLNQDYFHCDNCNVCISIELQKNHICIENSTKSNCPICDEFMFNSNEKVVFMTCGHPIHEKCYRQHTLHSYKCPTCSKTISNMELQFRMRDSEIKNSIMPDELRNWIVDIKCIDCNGMSRVPFHYLGHKCDHCHSYNTMQVKLTKGNEETHGVEVSGGSVDEKLYVAEQFIADALKQNFAFENQALDKRIEETPQKNNFEEEENDDDDLNNSKDITKDSDMYDGGDGDKDDSSENGETKFVNNFITVINNFEAYPSIGEAFKDWIQLTLGQSPSDDEDETGNTDCDA